MTRQLPEPLTPPECNLRGLAFVPMQVTVLQSTLFGTSTGDEFKAAFALWIASWSEVPAASLPNDEKMLAFLSRAKNWKKVRDKALHGWIECSDGRLYHPIMAEQALAAWDRRIEHEEASDNKTSRQQRWRERCAQLAEQLRALGVTPPRGASLDKLQRLLVDAQASTRPSTRDDVEIAKTGTETETVEGQGQPSVPVGTGVAVASPAVGGSTAGSPSPVDPRDQVFATGVALLTAADVQEKHARSFLAAQLKAHGPHKVLQALHDCAREKAVQPVPWIVAVLGKPAGGGLGSRQDTFSRNAEAARLLGFATPGTQETIDA